MNNIKKVVAPVATRVNNGGSGRTRRNRRRRQRQRAVARVERDIQLVSDSMLGLGIGPNSTRSGLSPNPADPRTELALASLGQTVEGRTAALVMLHPCGEGSDAAPGLPDGALSSSVKMLRRDEFNLAPATDATGGDWNCVIFSLPFVVATQIAVRWPVASTQDVNAAIQAAIRDAFENNYDPTYIYPQWFQIGTYTDFQVTILESSVLTPTIVQTPGYAGASLIFKSIRRVAYGVTTDLNAPTLADQGRVLVGQWNPDVALQSVQDTTGGNPPYYLMQIPAYTETEIVASDNKVYQAEAKCGDYMPGRVCQPTVEFTSSIEARTAIALRPGIAPSSEVPTNSVDIWLRGWTIGVERYSGISYQATLRLKRRELLELMPAPGSVYSPFETPGAPEDMRAMMLVREYSRTHPHAYPADYNGLGKMLQDIVGGIGSALGSLGIPVVSDIARGIGGVAQGPIGDSLAGLLGG